MKNQLLLLILFLSFTKNFAQVNLSLSLVSSNFIKISNIAHAGDSRLFVVEQPGIIKSVTFGGQIQSIPFLDISTIVQFSGEMGLLGLAFHPLYKQNGYFYVNYIDKTQNTVVARYQVSQTDSTVADANSGTILLTFAQPYTNHNGGDLNFGPDGYLYISTGDGGSGGDPLDMGQNKTTFLGKILRIDVDSAFPYAIPAGNPFADGAGGNVDEIWSFGLRNPWRFSFDKQNGDMWIADVGQNAYEEIDLEPAGSTGGINYGWRCYEGNHAYNSANCLPMSSYTFPIYEYSHSEGCSITGGYMYRGNAFPLLQGRYLYADFCNGKIWSLKKNGANWVNELLFQDVAARFSTFGENKDGELFIGDVNGKLYSICELTAVANNPNLTINNHPIPTGNYLAGNQLNSAGSVANPTSVGFYAYKTISLEPGFRVENGAVLIANVGVCNVW
jgi:glucose/arabinose dehydrogenase